MSFTSYFQYLINEDQSEPVTILMPGSFKPLHLGHLNLIDRYTKNPMVKELILIIGAGERDGIDQDTAYKVAKILTSNNSKVKVEKTDPNNTKLRSPITVAYEFLKTAAPGTYALAASNKGDDYKRVTDFVKQHQEGGKYYDTLPKDILTKDASTAKPAVKVIELNVDVDPAIYYGRTDAYNYMPISATILRNDLIKLWNCIKTKNKCPKYKQLLNNFYTNYRNISRDYTDKVLEILLEKIKSNDNVKESFTPSFKNVLNEDDDIVAQVNKHMTHLEDLTILSGSKGLDWAINIIINLFDIMKGNTPKDKIGVSVKIDGAPAIFAWSLFPGLEQPGIATKGLFAKEPKVAFSNKDIKKYFGDKPSLVYKLQSVLEQLPNLNIPANEIWQGDFLFDDKSLKIIKIEDREYYAFQPNTIMYVVPVESELGDKIKQAKVGIVWHTRYKGSSLDTIKATYDIDITELNSIPEIFMTDVYIKSFAGLVTFSKEETEQIEEMLSIAQIYIHELKNTDMYDELLNDEKLVSFITMYQNSLIKENRKLEPDKFVEELKSFISKRYNKEIETKKTYIAKAKYKSELDNYIQMLEREAPIFERIAELINILTDLKNKFISKLNNISKFDTYLNMKNGELRKTGQEGFAVSDNSGNIVKFVDRSEFSYANFSPDVIKGWEK